MKSRERINKPKLIKELVVLFLIAFVIFLVRFLPWLMTQPISDYDPYRKYQSLLQTVESYDFAKGANSDLENKLKLATKTIGDSPVQYYYNQKAKALYYQKIGNISTSIACLDEAIRFAPSHNEQKAVYSMYLENYKTTNDSENIKKYQELYDGKTN